MYSKHSLINKKTKLIENIVFRQHKIITVFLSKPLPVTASRSMLQEVVSFLQLCGPVGSISLCESSIGQRFEGFKSRDGLGFVYYRNQFCVTFVVCLELLS